MECFKISVGLLTWYEEAKPIKLQNYCITYKNDEQYE
jgi:hypothetical protein